ncbi:organic solvent tolerance protein OstA [Gracilibacillus alcaliphilus]|uniref:organic solvent tolerance protein OstA n=1 Tax=Gracilibacillus alcaliphilus TaxID=1401441 RepID=UPI001959EFF1|nr:organic solvent tolerance protein OstA [Gracilibacillus alcaliphilus]MBM7679546.1 hypothetical protein [Gracilibacillus alcaliphilus]
MAVKELNTKEQHYADTMKEAEDLVAKAKEDMYLISHGIKEKHNKYGTYYLVDLQFYFDTPKEIMEAGPEKEEEPEDVHEGIEYGVNQDGTVELENNGEDE